MKIIFTTDENADHDALCDAIRGHNRGPKTDVAVVAPALNSRLRYWLSDEDDARRSAEARLQNCISRLTASGFTAKGSIGDADPLQAIADSLAYAWADVLVVTTPRLERAHYLTKNLASRTRHHFGLPVLSLPLEEEPASGVGSRAVSSDKARGARSARAMSEPRPSELGNGR